MYYQICGLSRQDGSNRYGTREINLRLEMLKHK